MQWKLELTVEPGELAVCRLPPGEPVPAWATGRFLSITRTPEELSIVCDASVAPPGAMRQGPMRAIKVVGPLDFSLTGILAGIAVTLAAARVSIFAIATYDTDYVLVQAEAIERAIEALRGAGHKVLADEDLGSRASL